ncbi:MAG: ABC transporter permease subunit [Candidatus Aminicenantes bacterium]|nr:ABC transporter permease subunit [Candidatus Aminicenantes bacterium]
MRNIWIITKKELKGFLYTPIAYIITAFFLLVSGFFFYNIVVWFSGQSARMMQNPYYANQLNLNKMVFESYFNNLAIILMFLLPLLTMRLLSDERRMRTEELLLTSPLKISSIILGKYLAALIIYSLILMLTATHSIFIIIHGNPQIVPLVTAYLGLFLMGAVFIAIGIFASSLTENQIIAAVISFSTILLIWVISWIGEGAGAGWKGILSYLSFFSHFQNMIKGVVDTKDIVYYLSFSFMGIYFAYTVFEFKKWR